MLEQGSPLAVTEERLEIGFPEGAFALASLKDSDSLATLKEQARQFFKGDPAIVLRPLAPGAAEAPPNLLEKKRVEEEHRQTVLKQAATSHPAIVDALDIFGGTLAEVVPLERKEPR